MFNIYLAETHNSHHSQFLFHTHTHTPQEKVDKVSNPIKGSAIDARISEVYLSVCACVCVCLCRPFTALPFPDYLFFCQTVNHTHPPSLQLTQPTCAHSHTHCVTMATASPYCTHRFVNTQIDTPSQMKVARCRAKSCLRMSMSLQPPKQGSRWPTVVLKPCRNRGSTEQCFICAH